MYYFWSLQEEVGVKNIDVVDFLIIAYWNLCGKEFIYVVIWGIFRYFCDYWVGRCLCKKDAVERLLYSYNYMMREKVLGSWWVY